MASAWTIIAVSIFCFLHILAFLLAVGAESRRSTGHVVPDEYDDSTYCVYDSDASTAYGVSALLLLIVAEVLLSVVTRCVCCGRRHFAAAASPAARGCAVAAFVVSWITFLAADACLLAGSVRNAYHTKYVGKYLKRDLTSCVALRKGVFATASVLVVICFLASLVCYWCHSRAETAGFVKHQNEAGVGMTDYGFDQKGAAGTAAA